MAQVGTVIGVNDDNTNKVEGLSRDSVNSINSIQFITTVASNVAVEFINSTNGNSTTKNLPSGWQQDDLCVIFDTAGSNSSTPSDVTPSGWTKFHTVAIGGGTWRIRLSMFGRILQSGDSAPTGLNGTTAERYVTAIYRPVDATISAFNGLYFDGNATSGDPGSISVNPAPGDLPGIYVGQTYGLQATSPTFPGTWDTSISTSDGLLHDVGYRIANAGDSDASETVDVNDSGVASGDQAGFIALTVA